VESWESLRASQLSTPHPAAIQILQKPRYTNNPSGTKDRARHGDPKSARLVFGHLPRADERAAEQQQNSANKRDYENLKAKDLTGVELLLISQGFDPNLLR
jgi:hypothetical protein